MGFNSAFKVLKWNSLIKCKLTTSTI